MQHISEAYPLVSIITVNYNGLNDTDELIRSFAEYESYPAYEFIIVDNGSTTDEASQLQNLHPDIQVIRHINNGFAGGNNAALPQAKGEYLFFINNDTVINQPIIAPLVQRLQSDSRIGGVSPLIKFANQPDIIQYAGFTPFTPITLRNSAIGFRQKDCADFGQASPTAALHGAAMMVPRHMIDEIGSMTEVYFLFYEEFDWSERIAKAGYSLWYEPASIVMHKEGMTAHKDSPLRTFYQSRARVLYARRNRTGWNKWLSCLYLLTAAMTKGIFCQLVAGKVDLALAVLKGTLSGVWTKKD